MKKLLLLLLINMCANNMQEISAQKNKGNLSNLVVFISFQNENNIPFKHSFSSINKMFNDSTENANSVYNYFKTSSYSQLFWSTSFFPLPVDDKIISYTSQNIREYYMPYSEINLNGYKNDVEAQSREQGLIKEIAQYLSSNVPKDVVIDSNNDGLIDNLCIIIAGSSATNSSQLLWPHRGAFVLANPPLINDKRIAEYLIVFDDGNGLTQLNWIPLNIGVLCHEMSHTLGTYDLYHAQKGLNPVGMWDLMSDNTTRPQQMTAYTKFRYCTWLDEIPEISEPGTYTLNPIGGASKENIAYKIKPLGSDEYFVVEYRDKTNNFDQTLPSSGLIVYRINPLFSGGNVNYNSTSRLDEIYIFRPGGTIKSDGEIQKATFSAESGRTAFGGTADYKPFYSDGREAKFAISEISNAGPTLSFKLLPFTKQIYIPLGSVSLFGDENSVAQAVIRSDVDWTIGEVPEWVSVSPMSGQAGESTIIITSKYANNQPEAKNGEVLVKGSTETDITATLKVTQVSNLIHAPNSLLAVQEESTVALTWNVPIEGAPLINEGFENPDDKAGWTISSANYRCWEWTLVDKYFPAFQGNYSARLRAAFEEKHQNERLISPVFKQGKTLSFYSKTPAVNKINAHNFYQIEVSSDGGETWTMIYDVKQQGKLVNRYENVVLDISAYKSDNMRVSFYAYDDHNQGLAYAWQIDNVSVYPEVTESIVKGYNIYRNNEKIGESTSVSFVDKNPIHGDNIYQISAFGDWGETLLSESVKVNFSSTGLDFVRHDNENAVQLFLVGDKLQIVSEQPLKSIKVYSLSGQLVKQHLLEGTNASITINALQPGLYIAEIEFTHHDKAVKRKFINTP